MQDLPYERIISTAIPLLESEKSKLNSIATRRGRRVGQLCTEVIREYLEKYENVSTNPNFLIFEKKAIDSVVK